MNIPTKSFLNNHSEVHALGIGMYEGFKDLKDFDGLDKQAKNNPDVEEEIHYAKGGYVAGATIRVIIYILLGGKLLQLGLL